MASRSGKLAVAQPADVAPSGGISQFVEVAVPLPVHGTFTYAIPEELRSEIRLGSRVEVPWGSKLTTAFVTALSDTTTLEPRKIRKVRSLLDVTEPALLPEIIELCRWAATYYLAPFGEMLRVALPANMTSGSRRMIEFIGTDVSVAHAVAERQVLPDDLAVLDDIRAERAELRRLLERHPSAARAAVRRLAAAGLIRVEENLRDAAGVRYDRFVIVARTSSADVLPVKQQEVVDLLFRRGGEMSFRALIDAGASESAVSTLAKKGVVVVERRARRHTLDAFMSGLDAEPVGELRLSSDQRAAVREVTASLGSFAPFLLQGVTGSGKTEVYIELMRETVRRGNQAILLVPEISLTPVFAARLKERFGDRIAILHSSLSPSERFDQWWRARRGLVDVAIGPRSALFTPFPRLGLIAVDEEGDGAYKQEETPRYNARDLAVVRARLQSIPVILGSATPSLESRDNAESGKYRHLMLPTRVEARSLPEVQIIDTRKEKGEKEDRGLVIFSPTLRAELATTFARGEQAIILMNRRGYAPFLLCRECENDFRCRDCSVTLTVHRRAGLLICHYCGYRKTIPSACPLCQGEVLQPIGFGTEKVFERFSSYFPDVAADVLDRDSTRKRGELTRILDRFRRGETQALIGTQMLSKGHHFPNVTLTAVINADAVLGFPDFRSAEKTFYLLTQVAGRSGRGEIPGRVTVQTAFPQHYAIQHAMTHDYESFYRAEIEFRRKFAYPPATAMIAIILRGENERAVESVASAAGKRIEQELTLIDDVRVQGPAPAPLARIKGVFRYQILLRSRHRVPLRAAVEKVISMPAPQGVDVVIDVDPINIL